jgi:hypothetical protein
MGGVKGRSGPPGNLNNARYAWTSYWRRRALKPEHRWVRAVTAHYERELLADRPDATAVEAGLIQVASLSRGCTALLLDAAKQAGFTYTGEGGVLQSTPVLRELGRFLTIEQRALSALRLHAEGREFIGTIGDFGSALAEVFEQSEAERKAVALPVDGMERR